ncbi:dihydrodipicolinate synthase family protein [Streptomyces inhibens]|uniref:Dihydrodipicolinate synthase family protein n=1 Tax=Streptomyces inhibens TaxID=2293571 RepID=A0A371QBB7_STRIH|nr:dihydrodipicolinate synthase family protein [Streptomyces inhibens]REK91773.1 dihydrodipicolinate synthase family protein [Streptomyces inhibens]
MPFASPFPAPLTGVVRPLCTPLTESGQVDVRSPAALVEHLVDAGVDGLFVLGSTGEAACLSDIQRRTVIETVVDAASGRLPVLAGAIDMATARSGDEGALRRLLVRLPAAGRDFSVLTGSELSVDGALLAGADGVVPGLGNIDPAGYVRLYAHARAGRWQAAAAGQDRLAALFPLTDVGDETAMGRSSSALGAFKAALHLLGIIDCPATAAPQLPLDAAAHRTVRRLLEEAGLL